MMNEIRKNSKIHFVKIIIFRYQDLKLLIFDIENNLSYSIASIIFTYTFK